MRRDHTSRVSEVQEFLDGSQIKIDEIERIVTLVSSIQDCSFTFYLAWRRAPTKWRI